jgi:hypothetical protein
MFIPNPLFFYIVGDGVAEGSQVLENRIFLPENFPQQGVYPLLI